MLNFELSLIHHSRLLTLGGRWGEYVFTAVLVSHLVWHRLQSLHVPQSALALLQHPVCQRQMGGLQTIRVFGEGGVDSENMTAALSQINECSRSASCSCWLTLEGQGQDGAIRRRWRKYERSDSRRMLGEDSKDTNICPRNRWTVNAGRF